MGIDHVYDITCLTYIIRHISDQWINQAVKNWIRLFPDTIVQVHNKYNTSWEFSFLICKCV